jgi:hypothetical protein
MQTIENDADEDDDVFFASAVPKQRRNAKAMAWCSARRVVVTDVDCAICPDSHLP